MKHLCALLAALTLISFTANGAPNNPPPDNYMHEFVMSCAYGTLAGTLVGAASLAFTSEPGQNLNTVARGASLGLYAGILLGLYVVYIVPGMESSGDEEPVALADRFRFMVNPIFATNNRIDGLKADWTVMRF